MQQSFDPGLTQAYGGRLRRMVNRDGSFNVRRRGRHLQDLHLYQFFIRLSWPVFMAVLAGGFLVVTLAFTGLYFAAGVDGLQGISEHGPVQTFLGAFFFSVQTLTTVGYGAIFPRGLGANIVASVEALCGVLGFAFSAGILYGRFSRPNARILFSSHALVAPYQDGTSLQIRIANQRANALVDLEATLVLMTVEGSGDHARRVYAKLELERPTVFFLPLTWTIVHPIVPGSPLHGATPDQLESRAAEILVLVRGFDDTFSQVVNARFSYRYDEILWGQRFSPAFHNDHDGHLVLDLAKMDDVKPA
ncbi:MAG TPA: ion channel [Spirochaetia bacterium]|nr:ion channel [Spirochaetia bacterium]